LALKRICFPFRSAFTLFFMKPPVREPLETRRFRHEKQRKQIANQRLISSTSAAPARRCRSQRSSTTPSIEKPSASVTRSRITADACALTASSGSVTAIASAVNIMRRVTPLLWISLSRTATVPSAITSRTRVLLWKMSLLTVSFLSSSSPAA
jgi:hypothetical protein